MNRRRRRITVKPKFADDYVGRAKEVIFYLILFNVKYDRSDMWLCIERKENSPIRELSGFEPVSRVT